MNDDRRVENRCGPGPGGGVDNFCALLKEKALPRFRRAEPLAVFHSCRLLAHDRRLREVIVCGAAFGVKQRVEKAEPERDQREHEEERATD
jgi:hypothetical protein